MEAQVAPLDTSDPHALRQSWQSRVLRETLGMPFGMAVLSVVAHSYDHVLLDLMVATFPTFFSIKAPFLLTAAKIAKNGNIVADVATKDGRILKWRKLFDNTAEMEGAFRQLADRLKLSDADRIDMFNAVKRWVVCDYRIDPAMDAFDPDARRLVH